MTTEIDELELLGYLEICGLSKQELTTTQKLLNKWALGIVGPDELLDSQSEYDKTHFGHLKQMRCQIYSMCAKQTRNQFRVSLRHKIGGLK